jgi:DNA-binding beta-propeller fold protein YncE
MTTPITRLERIKGSDPHMQLIKSAAAVVATLLIALPVAPATPLLAATPTTASGFHVKDQWNIGGAGGWGFLSLDPVRHQLFIPRTNRITVVDTATGKPLGEINGMSSLRDLALDDSGKYGYATDVTDGTAGFVRVFDRSTYKLVASIPTSPIPFAIAFDPATKLVFAFSSRAHNATVIDTATNQAVATIALEGRPGSAIGDGKGSIFVALPVQGVIQRIDAASKKVAASWPLAPCTGPANLAIDTLHHQLFTTCEDHKLVAVNADTGHLAIIGNSPSSVGDLDFDPRTGMLRLADPAGSLTVFRRSSPLRYTMLWSVKTEPGARTMVVNHDTGNAYLVTAKFGLNYTTASEELHYRPTPVPGTFEVIVVGR